VGWRYTVSRREQRFISFVSLVSLLGLILGVTAMIVVLSVMNGFDTELKQRILKVIPHGFVENAKGFRLQQPDGTETQNWQQFIRELKTRPGIVGVAPVITGNALVRYADKTVAVQVNGVLPESLSQVSEVGDSMLLGKMTDLDTEPFGLVIGQVLARRLGIAMGDTVQVVSPQISVTPAGVFPRQKSFHVVGVFAVGADPDNELVLMHLDSAARLFRQMSDKGEPLVTQLQIRTTRMEDADRILAGLKTSLPGDDFKVSSWFDTHRSLFEAIAMEKHVISLLLFSVIVVAVFNIASILVMMVAEKRKDIAILRVMGAGTGTIVGIFVVQGLLVGLLGIVLGAISGSILALGLGDFMTWLEAHTGAHLFSPDVYYIAHLPSDWHGRDVATIVVVSLLLCIGATFYPAWKSGKIDPVQSLNE
jgi:lipoprotein-releasing system permease protein